MWNPFRRDSKSVNHPVETKSVNHPVETKSSNYFFNAVWNLIVRDSGFAQVTAWQALRYYEQISAVAIGIDKVTDEFKSLQPAIFDLSDQSYISDHPFLSFLQRPNASSSGQDFFKTFGNYFEIVGETYLLATGNPNRPPLELINIPPQFVSIEMGRDGFPERYGVNSDSRLGSVDFIRKEVNGRMRYYDTLSRELWHVKDFNPNASATNFNGQSKLNPVYFEIEQHLFGSQHNLSLLKRGGRLTGALVADEVLSEDDFSSLQEQIDKTISGALNAGQVGLFSGGVKYQEMGANLRDMDFAKLMQSVQETIFNRLGVPLPLVSSKQMTLNNFSTAQVVLYFNAVLPLKSKLYGELTLFLGPRFGLSEGQFLSVDMATIPALQRWRLDNLSVRNKLGVETVNEIRSALGREAADGGDVVLAPASMAPIARDTDTTDNRDKPASRSKFIEIMKEQKDARGERLYSDEQIDIMADEEGLDNE